MPTTPDAQMVGQAKREARRRRVSRIRRRTAGAALGTFAVIWAAIFFQLASGHDPALGKTSQAKTIQAQASQSQAAAAATSSEGTESYDSESDGTESYGTESYGTQSYSAPSSDSLGSVTTRQS